MAITAKTLSHKFRAVSPPDLRQHPRLQEFSQELSSMMTKSDAKKLTPEFFDLARNTRILARREGLSIWDARREMFDYPRHLLVMFDLRPEDDPEAGNLENTHIKPKKHGRATCPLPGIIVLARSIMYVREMTGNFPTGNSLTKSKLGLPSSCGLTWPTILRRMKRETGYTPVELLKHYEQSYPKEAASFKHYCAREKSRLAESTNDTSNITILHKKEGGGIAPAPFEFKSA